MKKTLLLACLGMALYSQAQLIVLRTSPPLAGGTSTSTNSGITMNVHAYVSLNIMQFQAQVGASGTGYEIWYNTDSISGPPNIIAANGWVMHETGPTSGGTPQTINLTTPLNIPAGQTYAICFRLLGSSVYYTSSPSPNTFTDGNMKISVGPLAGYAGTLPTPTLTPRGFTGAIGYVFANTAANDASVESIDGPNTCAGTGEVYATIKNNGINQINPVTVQWSVNGVAQTPVVYTNTLDTARGLLSQFAQVLLGSVNLTQGVTTTIVAYTELPNNQNDTVNDNDTMTKTFDVLPVVNSFPFNEDFESGQGSWFSAGTNSSWAFGTPAKTTIIGASSGNNAFVTGGLGTASHNNDEQSFVYSPCFDFTGFVGTPWVAMDVWWNCELGWDGAALQASVDGDIWQTIGISKDPLNWYTDSTLEGLPGGQAHGWTGRASEANSGSGGWVNARHGMDESFVGQIVRFRVAFGADEATVDDGFAFDDFRVVDYTAAQLGPDRISMCQAVNLTLDPKLIVNGNVSWSTGATTPTIVVATTGKYWVQYTDTMIDVTSSDTANVIQSPPLVINWAPYPDTIDLTGISTLNPRLPFDIDYSWSPIGSTLPYYVVRPSEFPIGTHTFTLNVVDSVQCSDESTVSVTIVESFEGVEGHSLSDVRIFPNPVNDVMVIDLPVLTGQAILQVMNLEGKEILVQNISGASAQRITLDLHTLNSGMYLLRLTNNGESKVFKVMKD